MTYAEISSFIRAQPFVPLTIHLADGKTIPVHRPSSTGWTRDRAKFVALDVEGNLRYFKPESVKRIEPLRASHANS